MFPVHDILILTISDVSSKINVNRKIKIPGTLSAARKGPFKASPEVHERRGERRKGPFRVELKGFAGILSR
jgi:hypothetical protein